MDGLDRILCSRCRGLRTLEHEISLQITSAYRLCKRNTDNTHRPISEPIRDPKHLNLVSVAQNTDCQTQMSCQGGNSRTACVECKKLPIIETHTRASPDSTPPTTSMNLPQSPSPTLFPFLLPFSPE